MADPTQIRETVERAIGKVLKDSGRKIPPITDETNLSDLRLDSLDFAVTVVQLERDLGVDPFRVNPPRVRTFADLVVAYEEALSNCDN